MLKIEDVQRTVRALENLSLKDLAEIYQNHDQVYLGHKFQVIKRSGPAYWACTLDSLCLRRLTMYINSFEV